ncbi:MAG: hypothetical protein KDA91_14020 [Planctomycetaceae bacterium]|nr:hypothetical protein [Planctomycetaceae bacterium]
MIRRKRINVRIARCVQITFDYSDVSTRRMLETAVNHRISMVRDEVFQVPVGVESAKD